MLRNVVFVAALLVAGCATAPLPSSQALKPPVVILEQAAFVSSPGTGAISVARDTGWIGSKCRMRVYLDATGIADLQPGETAIFYTAPGKHMLAAGPSPDSNALCRAGAESMRRELSVEVVVDKVQKFRQALSGNGEPSLMPTAF